MITRPLQQSARSADRRAPRRRASLLTQLNPWKLVSADPRARRRDRDRRRRRGFPACCSCSRSAGRSSVACAAAAPRAAPARRRARRRAGARARVVGAHLRIRLVLPAAVGVGARRAHAARDRLDRRGAVPRTYEAWRVRALGASLAAIMLVVSRRCFAVDAAHVDVQSPRINETLGSARAADGGCLARNGRRTARTGPYLVTWLPDPEAIGSQGFGLLNELDRRGFDVRAPTTCSGPGATRYHVIDPAQATLAGASRDRPRHRTLARTTRGSTRSPRFDPRTDAEREPSSTGCTTRSIAQLEAGRARRSRAAGRRQPVHAGPRAERAGRHTRALMSADARRSGCRRRCSSARRASPA